ncbi:MAG TPA: heavy metal-binding domain-containing protein [Candidatus Tyrphobacter sp.]
MIHEVVTFEEPAGYQSRRDLGFISGSASRPRNLLRSTFRSLGILVGLAPIESLSEADELRAEALAGLSNRAEEIGANAVVGVQFHVAEDEGACKVTAFGRALEIERTR